MGLLVPIHLAVTLYMTGVIWFVQRVHYPLMDGVGAGRFRDYEARHARRTGWVVGPPMLVELVTAILLVLPGQEVGAGQARIGLGLLALIWLSTALLQVPLHRRLAGGFDPSAHRRLVATNWIRTTAWSARAVLVSSWLV